MANVLSVYLNKHLRNRLIEYEVEQRSMLYKLWKRFYQIFRFCHSLDEDVNSVIWLLDDGLAFTSNIEMQHTAGNKHKKCRNEIYRSTKIHYLYRSYDCARATDLEIASSHMIKTCDMQQTSHKAKYKRQTSLTSMKQTVE